MKRIEKGSEGMRSDEGCKVIRSEECFAGHEVRRKMK